MRCDIAIGVAILLQRVPRSEKRFHSCHQDRHYPSRVYKLHRPKQLAFARQLCGLPPCCCFRCLVLPTWRTSRRLYNRSLPVCRVFPILAYKRQQGKKKKQKTSKQNSLCLLYRRILTSVATRKCQKINPPTRQDRNPDSYDTHSRNKSHNLSRNANSQKQSDFYSSTAAGAPPLPFLPFQEADRQQSDLFPLNSKKTHKMQVREEKKTEKNNRKRKCQNHESKNHKNQNQKRQKSEPKKKTAKTTTITTKPSSCHNRQHKQTKQSS